MFFKAFEKIAILTATVSPEHYYELKTDKYPHEGANIGSVLGGALGAYKGKHGGKSKAALIGAAVGGAGGAAAGKVTASVAKNYQLKKFIRSAEEMNIRSTPSRKQNRE